MRIDSFSGEYRFLSNFADSPFAWEGYWFLTNEHFYQALKCQEFEQFERIRNAGTPGEAKRLGRRCELRLDWEQVKDDVMLTGLRHKFYLNAYLRERLIATGDAELVEGNTWGDRYWGVCRGVGQNKLGQLLMQVRNEVR